MSAAWKAWRMVDEGWASGDSWVLTAVAISGRGAGLSGLIASGDACNHAILERREIEQGLGRLAASGLVHVHPGLRVRLSKDGKRITRRAKGGIVEQLLQMSDLLRDVPLREGRITVTPDEYAEALQSYYERARTKRSTTPTADG